MEKYTSSLCPRIQVLLKKQKSKAPQCDVMPSTDTIFNVSYLDHLVVDLEAMTCTCKMWELMGVPCCHAITCIFFLNKQVEDYVDKCYSRDVYLLAYGGKHLLHSISFFYS